ncbi:MAG TPA: hypothetical protein VLB79_08515 [Solirubrobacterales bacterium]|nr:hypothetical protein [Solirubrobacterales bacterium]
MKKKRGITIRFGPLGLSLLAAGITAVGVAAVSLADSGNGSGSASNGSGTQTFRMPAPPRGAAGATVMGDNLSAEDRQKLEDFRKCMEDNGAPAPPDPGKIDPSDGPPKPPSAADREKIQKAYEACKSKLPEKLRDAGPPGIGTFHCGPPPGPPPAQGQSQDRGRNQDQSNPSSTQPSGAAA